MDKIEVNPLAGIVFNDIEIKLGADENDVKAALGEPYSVWKNSLYYFKNELRFDFGKDGAEFIEFLGGIDGELQPTIYGVPAFQTGADKLYEILRQQNNGGIDDSESPYSYGFLESSVGVYREIAPEDVQEMTVTRRKTANRWTMAISNAKCAVPVIGILLG